MEIARRKRKLADAKESRQWADGVVSTFARSEGRTSPFVRPYENENYEMEKELEKSWGKMGEGAMTATGVVERKGRLRF